MGYARPPITEAVLELRFAVEQRQDTIEAAARKMKSLYLVSEPMQAFQFRIDIQEGRPDVPTTATWHGIRLSSDDRADVVVLRKHGFTCSRMAPYLGWDHLRENAQTAWEAWRRAAGFVEVSRIGLRYINRIDVPPHQGSDMINVEDYITFVPAAPVLLEQPMSAYTIQMTKPLGHEECHVTLTSSSVPSPLVGYASFVLDVDVSRQTSIPRREDALWELIERMRDLKNFLFEGLITDKSRELFRS